VVYSVLGKKTKRGGLSRAGARRPYDPDRIECDGRATPYNTAPAVPMVGSISVSEDTVARIFVAQGKQQGLHVPAVTLDD
jgi:hypothetical protein